jgi:hypothetical protein
MERTFIVCAKVCDHDADLLDKVPDYIRTFFAGTAVRIIECEPETKDVPETKIARTGSGHFLGRVVEAPPAPRHRNGTVCLDPESCPDVYEGTREMPEGEHDQLDDPWNQPHGYSS